jgi:hypothetical protein
MENTVTVMGMLPLIVMTLITFFFNRWVGKKVGVWTTGVIICSLIPILSSFIFIFMVVSGIARLSERIAALEAKT